MADNDKTSEECLGQRKGYRARLGESVSAIGAKQCKGAGWPGFGDDLSLARIWGWRQGTCWWPLARDRSGSGVCPQR